ncbi:calcium-binding protein [Methylobacterium durans]|uniref:Calcium-binding protein n=1 Tax=Methylobacterium durans TaxID=2202825 RepID=A0A2U8WC70_9HYPH|nr:calcium-binding protein [Methylobacterium durans]AWN43208.1 hypothetical protein DK389_25275 [Methylobacterium durans]
MVEGSKNAAEYASGLANELANGVPSYIDDLSLERLDDSLTNLELIEKRLGKFADSFKKIDGALDDAVNALGSKSADLIGKGTHISATALGKLLPVMDGLNDANKVLDQGGSVQDAALRGVRSASVAILSGEIGTIAGGIAIGAAATLGAAPIAAAVIGATVSIGAAYVIGETVNGALNYIEPLEGRKPVPVNVHSFSLGNNVDSLDLTSINATAVIPDKELLVFDESQIDKTFSGAKWSFDPKTYEFKWLDEATRYKFEQTAAALDLQQEVLQKVPDIQANVTPTSAKYEFFSAGAGNDIIGGSDKTDILLGKAGNDRLGGGGGDDVIFGGTGADILIGGSGNDRLLGQEGADTLIGQAGDDQLDGGSGADYMWGGEGNDTYFVDDIGDRISDDTGQGNDTVYTSIDYSLSSDVLYSIDRQEIENLHANAGSKGLSLHGNWLANKIYSGAGDDQMMGFVGNDTYYVNSQGDRVFEDAHSGYDTVRTDVDYTLQAGQEIELLTCSDLSSSIGLKLTGNEFDNKFIGGSGANVFEGGEGNDTYVAMNNLDVVIEKVDSGTDAVESYISYELSANVENLFLMGSESKEATGNKSDNVIIGNAGSNLINGKLGNDILSGGAGNDTFCFSSQFGPSNVDHISDFEVRSDTFRLDKSVFSGLTSGEFSGEFFKDITSQDSSIDDNDRILYDHNTGNLYFDYDGKGSIDAVLFAVLDNRPTLLSQDFFVI